MKSASVQDLSHELTEHFFRHEYAKMVAVLTRYLGVDQLQLAEDVVQETLAEAMTSWDFKGVPNHPKAWLYTVAKNKAVNILKRQRTRQHYEPQLQKHFETTTQTEHEDWFTSARISDDQLRMMFVCCHPSLSQMSQIALILKTLCGFSVLEIAKAFLTTKDTTKKRLTRARKTLREQNVSFELPSDDELAQRVHTILKSIYLLFNEGYKASEGDEVIRYDLCQEAIRLSLLLLQNPLVKEKSEVHALLALMYLNASRFKARQDSSGHLIEMAQQNRSLWDQSYINAGLLHLQHAKNDKTISPYHILGTISAYHCTAKDDTSTNWIAIYELYQGLAQVDNSPVVLLNQAIAQSKVEGISRGIEACLELLEHPAMKTYTGLYTVLATLHMKQDNFSKAIPFLQRAQQLTNVTPELHYISKQLEQCMKKVEKNM